MIKKVSIKELKPGMFVHDFNCGWLNHPFFRTSLKIENEQAIEKIVQHGIKEVYIDTEKGPDVSNAPTKEEVDREIQIKIDKIPASDKEHAKRVVLSEELDNAMKIKNEAKQTVHNIMEDIRFGRPVETEKVEHVVDSMIESIFRNQDALISLAKIKKADEYTYVHSLSVCVLMLSFCRNLGFDRDRLREIGVGAMLHDIGKMKVPQDLLNSERKLSDDEYEKIKEHARHSRSILEHTSGISGMSVLTAAQHHERIDGSGYPEGLKDDEITLSGQAAAIADVYDAMTSKRCYQKNFEPTDVLKKLFEWDSYYNPNLVQQFVRCVGIYPAGSLVRLESGLLAVVVEQGENNILHPVVKAIYDTKKQQYISPYLIDLSRQNGSSEKIESYDFPEKWKINTGKYIG